MQDRPTATELLDAVRRFLERDVVPAMSGPKKFHARVAANLMSILEREWRFEEEHLYDEWRGLAALLGREGEMPPGREQQRAEIAALNRDLAERIRRGDADDGPWRAEVMRHLRLVTRQKLAVANPAMLEER